MSTSPRSSTCRRNGSGTGCAPRNIVTTSPLPCATACRRNCGACWNINATLRSHLMPVQLESPYLSRNFSWLRGNLHAHTTLSDGASPPEEVLADYEKSGYDFMAISDHDLLVPTEKYQPCTEMTLIPADEVSARGPHILAVQIKRIVPPTADRQKVIDRTNAQGGFAVINHPNWQDHFNHCPHRLMEKW